MSKYGMLYLVMVVLKFPFDWHKNLTTLVFDDFSSNFVMIIKNRKIGPKLIFF